VPERIALAAALSNAAEHRIPTVLIGDVTNQLIDDDALAHTCATKDANLASPGKGREQVDGLDARLIDFNVHGLFCEWRGGAVDG